MVNENGFTLYGTYIEPGFDACLNCEIIVGCRERSPYCRLKQLNACNNPEIPDGWMSAPQIASKAGVDVATVRVWMRRYGRSVGARRYRYNPRGNRGWIMPVENLEALLAIVEGHK